MNMQSLMAQAQKLQKDLEKAQTELQNTVFTGESGAVKVEISGKYEVKSLTITDDSVLTDKEMLEDMIKVAFNNALNELNKTKNAKLGKYSNGLGGLF